MARFTRRKFLSTTAALGVGAVALPRFARAQAANDTINVGVIGCGGRGNELIGQIKDVKGVQIVALCDPDTARTAEAKPTNELADVKEYTDLRKLLEDNDVDAVVVATCNHWHCLAAVWACEAGKDVYCEKPLSHRLWEGRQLDRGRQGQRPHRRRRHAAAQRSPAGRGEGLPSRPAGPRQDQVGRHPAVRRPRYDRQARRRRSIRRRPSTTTCGLARRRTSRSSATTFHYDWHWSWNTGDGECGNWGVHLLDDVVNVVFRDKHKLPDPRRQRRRPRRVERRRRVAQLPRRVSRGRRHAGAVRSQQSARRAGAIRRR